MPGYHHVEHVMGMAVSIDVHDDVSGRPGLAEVLAWLHHVDQTFSTYLDTSEITRLGRGELTVAGASNEVVAILERCEQLRAETGGIFDAFAVPAPNGTMLDPSGLVKGWSIEEGAHLLEAHGLSNFCINAGGDVVVRGRPCPDPNWRIGIRHPDDPSRMAAVVEAGVPLAVATSATYERGAHIIDPRTGQPATEIASATVVGSDLTLTDAYATVLFILATDGLDWMDNIDGYDAMVIDHDGRVASSPGFPFKRPSSSTAATNAPLIPTNRPRIVGVSKG